MSAPSRSKQRGPRRPAPRQPAPQGPPGRADPRPTEPPRPLPAWEPDYADAVWASADGPVGEGADFRCGAVTLVGQPNAGKSTLLNRLLGQKLAIVSQRPQTTRDNLRGVLTTTDAQFALLDTPGIHKARSPLNRAMIGQAVLALEGADVVVVVVDARRAIEWLRDHPGADVTSRTEDSGDGDPDTFALDPRLHPGDRRVIRQVVALNRRWMVALNKVDRIKPRLLLPLMAALQTAPSMGPIVPVSAWTGDGIPALLRAMRSFLPEGRPAFAPDDLTDRPLRWLCAEFVREQVFRHIREEVPYGVVCQTEAWEELPDLTHIQVVVHVEKAAQRAILVGRHGAQMKALATAARAQIEALVDRKVFLEVFVRVEPGWSERADKLKEFGYL